MENTTKMTEFDKDTLIHLVIPASQWDEMWELYQAKNKVKKGKPGEGFEGTNWYNIHVAK
jgi:hypothetical protein